MHDFKVTINASKAAFSVCMLWLLQRTT